MQEVGARGELWVVDWVGDCAVGLLVKDRVPVGAAFATSEEED